MPPQRLKPIIIRDEIHGDMTFDRLPQQVLDHECFQRLRYIKQLGLAEYVFPCANHTRFQHSLGAAFLASQYFHSMVKSWMEFPFHYEGVCDGTQFHSKRTFECVRSVILHEPSLVFWRQVAILAGMLHDIGHGPWSHTFEYLDLDQDFRALIAEMDGTLGDYFKERRESRLMHEDISILYIFYILRDLAQKKGCEGAEKFFLPVATLVNRKLVCGPYQKSLEEEMRSKLQEAGIKGGTDFHTLLRPIISGPFDVDRIDYIQRDGRNCGVSIGGIEWRRIVSKLVPCLADHTGKGGEPSDVVLVSNIKNQHVLDDFVFSLFQMYAQVYMHPKIVGFEEIARRLLAERGRSRPTQVITFDVHRSLSDEKFREFLKKEFGVPELESILLREAGYGFKVASYPENSSMDNELLKNEYRLIETAERPMLKDSVGVFLYGSSVESSEGSEAALNFLEPWNQVSPIASQFSTMNFSPKIWVREELQHPPN